MNRPDPNELSPGRPAAGAAVSDVEGVLVAGGAARRFGRDKRVATVGGQAMALRAWEVLGAVVRKRIALGGPAERAAALRELLGPTAVVVEDPGEGPLVALGAALACTRAPWLLALACDMPAVTPSVLATLVKQRGECAHAWAIVPRDRQGRPQPLCALYARAVRASLEAAVARGERSMLRWLAELDDGRVAWVEFDVTSDVFDNANTEEELWRIERRMRGTA